MYLLMLNYELGSSYLIKTDVYTLIDKVVYTPLNEAHRDFLTSMSCFDSFTIQQAVFIWNGEDPSIIIDELVSKNAFVTFDYNNKSYHMHSILCLFKKIREDIENKRWYLFIHTLDMCEAYIYSCPNFKEYIPNWISQGEFKNTRLLFPSMAFLNIVYGRVLLINGEYLKLIGISMKLKKQEKIKLFRVWISNYSLSTGVHSVEVKEKVYRKH